MPRDASTRSFWRAAPRWGAAWVLVTSAGVWLHWATWLDPSRGSDGAMGERLCLKVVGNIQHILTMPAWAVMNYLRNKWGVDSVWWSVLTLAIGWAGVLYVVNGLWRTRRRLSSRPKAGGAPCATHDAGSGGHAGVPDLARRRLIFDGALGVGGVLMGAGLVRGIMTEPWDLVVRRYTVRLPGLPRSLDGYRIVQVSDTHLGPRIPASYVRAAVETTLGLKPDLVALTGDYIHMGVRFIDLAAELFVPLTQGARAVPVVGTLGNHDWWGDGPAMSWALRAVGVEMIDNDRVFLDASSCLLSRSPIAPGKGLCLAGLGDLREDSIDPRGALAGVPPDMPRIVLAHNPDSAEEMEVAGRPPPRIDVMLSGHTHGGQVHIPGLGTPFLPSRYGQKYAGGMCRGPHCPVVVSRGVGMSIWPVRLGVPPEIVEITLALA